MDEYGVEGIAVPVSADGWIETGDIAPTIREGSELQYLAPAANVPALPVGTTDAEREAAQAEVPFS
jgi:hypothetical protein